MTTKKSEQKSIKLFRMYPHLEEIKCHHKPGTKEAQEHFKHQSGLHRLMHDDNPYLFSGYRKLPVNSLINSFWSAFTLHNDTWNIWTHGLPALYWMYVTLTTDSELKNSTDTRVSVNDRLVFFFYSFCAMWTMILSAMYHTWRMNTEGAYHYCLKCDLRGIVMTLAGANVLVCYLIMRNIPFWSTFYLTACIAGLLALAMWIPRMVRLRLTNQRTVYFSLYTCIGLIATLHRHYFLVPFGTLLNNGSELYKTSDQASFQLLVIMGVVYALTGLGLVVRNIKGPERFFPYKFDLYGSSHQLFHVICVIGAIVNYVWVLDMFKAGAFFP